MNRIRFAMASDEYRPMLTGTVECDEVYIGPRKPRHKGVSGGRSTLKTPVFCAVERGGQLRRRVVADVTAATLQSAIREQVDSRARSAAESRCTNRTGTDHQQGLEKDRSLRRCAPTCNG